MNPLIFIATVGGIFWYFIRKAQLEQQQQPKAVVNIGPFTFTVPKSAYIDAAIERIKTKTSIASTDEGILLTFPSIPVPVPYGLGTMELPLKKKMISWDTIGQKLSDYQSRNLMMGITKGLMGIKSESVNLVTSRITIPQMRIPIY